MQNLQVKILHKTTKAFTVVASNFVREQLMTYSQ